MQARLFITLGQPEFWLGQWSIWQIDYIFTCVCTVIYRRWCHSVYKEQKVCHKTKLSGVTVVLYMLWRLLWSITVQKNVIYLFYIYNKNSNGLWKGFRNLGARKKKHRSADVDLTSSMCVCLLAEHGQQPMKMHTEFTLLYKWHQIKSSNADILAVPNEFSKISMPFLITHKLGSSKWI